MRKPILLFTVLLFFSNYLFAQNSMVGDGFGGRGWYVPHNYQVGAYSAYTVCGDSNQLYGWGSNLKGQLGNGTQVSTVNPVEASGMTNVKFYATGYVCTAIKFDFSAWIWGSDPTHPSGFSSTPVQIMSNIKFVDAGISHAIFIKNDGTIWGIGANTGGELGNGTTSPFNPVTIPVQMVGINNAVRAAAVGVADGSQAASIILLSDSTVKITGGGGSFQANNSTTPVNIPGLRNIVDIKGGRYAAFALDDTGNVYSFGFGVFGVLGTGVVINNYVPPAKITFPQGASPIVAISANNDGFTCFALDSSHSVYAWGYNEFGGLGDGTIINRSVPVLVATDVIDIFAGETFTYILKSDGTLWGTGRNGYENFSGSIWMNLPNIQRNVFTQIDPTIPPMNLCAPKVWGVVPIKLSAFTCAADNSNAILNWQSAEETNASKYIVEYSNDGRNFQSIATIFAKGSNSQYNYIHFNVSGTAFYRLKMMDKDGTYTYSEIRVVKFNGKAGVTIAPNPANDVVSVFTKSNTPVKTIQLISIDGRILKGINNYNSGQQINIAKFTSGTYVLKVIYSNADVEYVRFIKN